MVQIYDFNEALALIRATVRQASKAPHLSKAQLEAISVDARRARMSINQLLKRDAVRLKAKGAL